MGGGIRGDVDRELQIPNPEKVDLVIRCHVDWLHETSHGKGVASIKSRFHTLQESCSSW